MRPAVQLHRQFDSMTKPPDCTTTMWCPPFWPTKSSFTPAQQDDTLHKLKRRADAAMVIQKFKIPKCIYFYENRNNCFKHLWEGKANHCCAKSPRQAQRTSSHRLSHDCSTFYLLHIPTGFASPSAFNSSMPYVSFIEVLSTFSMKLKDNSCMLSLCLRDGCVVL